MLNLKNRLLLLTFLALFVSSIGAANAKNYGYQQTQNYHSKSSYSSSSKSNRASYSKTHRYAQAKVRSRSEVMSEVKQRYNAKVLKISLNEKSGVYNVRILMPSGKVRSIKVNAR